jgi:hypothetical protein
MGRYISGDINRKLWFAVQSSNAADRFGFIGCEPNYIEYYFNKEDNLEELQNELKNIEDTIGLKNMEKLNKFFEETNGYNDKIMEEHNILNIWNKHKVDYADYLLGKDIEKCLLEKGECNFQAEL